MSKRKFFSLIGLILTGILIVCLFIPFYDFEGYYYADRYYSLWTYLDKSNTLETPITILIELGIAALAYILQLTGASKDSKLAYLGLGFFFTFYVITFVEAIDNSAFDQLAFGFWIGIIVSTLAVLTTFIGNCLSNEHKKRSPKKKGQITGYDPVTGKPIYAVPTGFNPETGEPIFAKITGYDPETGKPIYEEK